jgi:hypothetical protein
MLRLASGEDWLWRPAVAGLCSYRDITESRVDLCAIAEMNELLDVRNENSRRLAEAAERRRRTN